MWLSIVVVIVVVFCLNQVFFKQPLYAHSYFIQDGLLQGSKANDQPESYLDKKGYVSIPFRFLPNYKLQKDSNNKPLLINEEGRGKLDVSTNEIAIVLVDTWNNFDNDKSSEAINYLRNVSELLGKCRENGITVIHAPNHPVVDKYPQYDAIKKEVEDYVEHNSKLCNSNAVFLEWPGENKYSKMVNEKREEGRIAGYSISPMEERDISKLLKPLEDEYVLSTYNEFRYVLWKEKIKVILYVGGALNECMLHRDTGINLLAGIDSKATDFCIVVIEDCVYIMDSPHSDYEKSKQAMLDYYKRKIAVVSNSQEMNFH